MIPTCTPKYPDKWDSHNFVFHCPDRKNDPLHTNKVMKALDPNPIKIYRILKGQDEQLDISRLGSFKLSATTSNVAQLADKIDSLLGEGYICLVPANVRIDVSNQPHLHLKFHRSIGKVEVPREPYSYKQFLGDCTKVQPFIDLEDNPLIGEFTIHLTAIKG